jgi:undecaprenyl-diphosphatase
MQYKTAVKRYLPVDFSRASQWAAREFGILAALAVAAGGILGFIALADEVREGEIRNFDSSILLALRNPADHADPVGPQWLEIAMRDLTSLGSVSVLTFMVAAALGYLLLIRKRGAALLVLVSIGGGTALSSLLKLGFDRPRPDLVAHLVDIHTLSFPSGHAMLSAVTYLTLGALLARVDGHRAVKFYILGVAVALTLVVGISRVYLGVHWPSDVLAGWCAGAAWAMLCWLVALVLQRRGAIAPGADAEPGEADRAPAG